MQAAVRSRARGKQPTAAARRDSSPPKRPQGPNNGAPPRGLATLGASPHCTLKQVEEDLEIVQNLAATASRRWEVAEDYDVVGLMQEFAETLRAEPDYFREGRSAERFAKNFSGIRTSTSQMFSGRRTPRAS
jgi:ABC1 atypical kinase-like domain